MHLVGTRGQQLRDHLYDASALIVAGGTPQLVLPEHKSRSYFYFQNLSNVDMYVEFGAARATCTISSGKLATFSITNAGFGYTYPPTVELFGGGNSGNSAYLGVAAPNSPAPGDPAYVWPRTMDMSTQKLGKAHAVLTGAAVTSIAIEDPGAGYQIAPMVFLKNSLRDPYGAAIPGTSAGYFLPGGTGGSILFDSTMCPTDPVAVFCATTSSAFICKYAG